MKNTIAICLVLIQFVYHLSVSADTYEQITPISEKLKMCENKEIPLDYLLKKNKRFKGYSVSWWGIDIPDARPGLLKLLNRMFLLESFGGHSQLSNLNILKEFPGIEKCKHEICIAGEIFGKERGIYMLYFLDKYNFNLSPYASYFYSDEDKYEDRNFFTVNELKTISDVFNMLPPELFKHFKFGSHFKKINKDKGNVIADSAMRFYSLYSRLDTHEQAASIIHELGHNMADVLGLESLDEKASWLALSDWKIKIDIDEDKKETKTYENDYSTNNFASEYAKASPIEDFAEAFSAYVVNPNFLKAKSKSKYNFLKNNIFGGIEYTSNSCQTKGDKKVELKNISSQDKSASCMNEFILGIKTVDDTEYNRCLIKNYSKTQSYVLSSSEDDIDQIFSKEFLSKKKEDILSAFVNIIFSRPEYCEKHPTLAFSSDIVKIDNYEASSFLYYEASNLCRWASNGIKDKKNLRENLKQILRDRVFNN